MRLLFVGNSYTFFNAVHQQVAAILTAAGIPSTARFVGDGGYWLSQHLEERLVQSALAAGGIDQLVLQEQSTRPLHNRADFLNDVSAIAGLAKCPVTLFQTWARQTGHVAYAAAWSGGSPEAMLCGLEDAYDEAAALLAQRGTAVRVAPVGKAFAQATAEGHALFDEDGHHASVAGSRLAALVLAETLLGGAERGAGREGDEPLLRVAREVAAGRELWNA